MIYSTTEEMTYLFSIGIIIFVGLQMASFSVKKKMVDMLGLINSSYQRKVIWGIIREEIDKQTAKGKKLAPLMRQFKILRICFFICMLLFVVLMFVLKD